MFGKVFSRNLILLHFCWRGRTSDGSQFCFSLPPSTSWIYIQQENAKTQNCVWEVGLPIASMYILPVAVPNTVPQLTKKTFNFINTENATMQETKMIEETLEVCSDKRKPNYEQEET